MREMIALVRRETRSRRVAGTKRKPSPITAGSDIRKYNVRTKIVSDVKVPEITVFPTPTTPPKAEISRVPSPVIALSFVCNVSIRS